MSWVTSIGSLHGPKLSLILLLRRAMSSKRISSSMRRALSPGARPRSSARALTDPDAAPRLPAVRASARRRVSPAPGHVGALVAVALLLVVAAPARAAAAIDLDAETAVAALPPRARRPWDFSLPPPPAAGTFPLVLRLRYTDADGRPAAALLVRTLGAADAGPVRAALAPAPIATLGTVQLTLENPEGRPLAGRVVAVLPPELATDPESQPAQVPPGGHVALPLVVQNARAVVGRTYPMYAVFEYDWAGTQRTAVAAATLAVVQAPSRRALRLAVGATAWLAALATAALLSRRAARRAAPRRH